MFNSLQTKLQLNHRPPFEPPAGLSPADLNSLWNQLEKSEHDYSLALLAEYRRQKKIKDLITRMELNFFFFFALSLALQKQWQLRAKHQNTIRQCS
jgi:hypothetical protein